MGFLDRILDVEKTSKAQMINPRVLFEDILKQASGSSYTRDIKYNIYYQTIAFYGVVDGVGTSTLVANTALALAKTGLTICVIDTSILAPVQDVLLSTDEAVVEDNNSKKCLDWFDLPYTKTSTLHVSKLAKNISVLSFKGKNRGVIDFLSTNDSGSLVDIALSTLHNKFDIILIDCCHELSAVNTACLQQAEQVIQVWNDSPTVVASLESFITNSITLSCPLDKMRYIVANRVCKDSIGNLDSIIKQYRCKLLATNYLSEELYLQAVTGNVLFQVESTDELVIAYTDCIIKILCHILNIDIEGDKPSGTVTSNQILNGEVEGTYHKSLKDFNEQFSKDHPEVNIEHNPDNAFNVGVDNDEATKSSEDTSTEEGTTSKGNNAVMEDDITPEDSNGVSDAPKPTLPKHLFKNKRRK